MIEINSEITLWINTKKCANWKLGVHVPAQVCVGRNLPSSKSETIKSTLWGCR